MGHAGYALLVLSSVLLSCQAVGAATTPEPHAAYQVSAVSGVSEDEQQFLMGAAAGNMAEVALGKIASEHCQSDRCKAFARRMMTDHSRNLEQLKALAKSLDVVLPKEPSSEFTSLASQLAKAKGKTFDELYLDAMVEDHTHDVGEFTDESKKAENPKVKRYASETLPVLKEHLEMAKDARAAVH